MDYTHVRDLIEAEPSLDLSAVNPDTRADVEQNSFSEIAIAAIEAWWNVPVECWCALSTEDFASHLELEGLLQLCIDGTDGPAGNVCSAVQRIAEGRTPLSSLDMSDADKRTKILAMLAALVTATVWTQEQADGVEALAKETVPRWRSDPLVGAPVGRGIIVLIRSGRVG